MTLEKYKSLKGKYKTWEILEMDGYNCVYLKKDYESRGFWVVFKDGELVEDDIKIKRKITSKYTWYWGNLRLRSDFY